jgi:hypothetical protein
MTPAGWTTKDENEFTVMLTKELDKIHDFQKAKVSCLLRLMSGMCEVKLMCCDNLDLGTLSAYQRSREGRSTARSGGALSG